MSSSGITINSNIASLQAQRQLSKTNQGLQKTFERLSSGMRIVRASDDAAGLAIASSLSTDQRVYTQAVRNLNDGVSYLNITDGAIDQLKTIVMRCRELATQAANGTMTSVQRSALDQEAQALSREYNRILATSEFNDSRVFDAANATVSVQCGYGSTEAISAQSGEGAVTANTTRVTTNSSGAEATGGISAVTSFSADGRYVVFQSTATNLVSGDTNGRNDVFVKDLQTGETQRVSTSSSGAQAGGGVNGSYGGSISADGRYLVFHSDATNLVAGDTNGQDDVFLKDLQTGETRRVSTSSSEGQGSAASSYGSISSDGRYVVFQSYATNLVDGDSNGTGDIFIKDLQTGQTRLVSTTSSGEQATNYSQDALISADGRYVAFTSAATNLVSGDTNARTDAFVKDLQTGETRRVNTTSSGVQVTGNNSFVSSISADGSLVVFTCAWGGLVAGDTNGKSDVFVKDLNSGETTRVSTNSSGAEGTGGTAGSLSGTISADGRYVAFNSDATNLVAGDLNARRDVFVKDVQTGELRRVSILDSGAESTGGLNGSAGPVINSDGRYVAFYSDASNLVDGDFNAEYDGFVVNNLTEFTSAGFDSLVRPLAGIYLGDQALARMAQSTLDCYLTELNSAQGLIGSSLSRFSVALSTLGVLSENITAAASRITDVDVADESSELTRRNILQQAASAVLAQANQQPQIALSLLR